MLFILSFDQKLEYTIAFKWVYSTTWDWCFNIYCNVTATYRNIQNAISTFDKISHFTSLYFLLFQFSQFLKSCLESAIITECIDTNYDVLNRIWSDPSQQRTHLGNKLGRYREWTVKVWFSLFSNLTSFPKYGSLWMLQLTYRISWPASRYPYHLTCPPHNTSLAHRTIH